MKTESFHILCVNPWIHDFAAFDFWARPYGLLSIAAILREKGFKISYIDCLDRFHPRETVKAKVHWDGRGPYRKERIPLPKGLENVKKRYSRYGINPDWFKSDLKKISKPDLIFVTSVMTYWASGVKETIDILKKQFPDVPVILGGIYASLCHEHAGVYSGADLVVRGPAEKQLSKILERFLDVRCDLQYLDDDLDRLPYPAFDLQNRIPYIPVLTSRGCPFSCDYCASSFLEPRLRRRSPQSVYHEIKFWHEKYGVKNFAFYDDALLVNAKHFAFPLFEKIIASGMDLFFHTPNAVHIREITAKAARLMFQCGFKTIRMGLETTDFGADRSHDIKVAENEFRNAVDYLKSAGFKSGQLGAYLLCGLPDQNMDDVEHSMNWVKDAGILPVLAFYTPIPHTAMWEKAIAHSKYELNKHPVFTNNTLFPCVLSNADQARISRLKNMSR